MEMLVYVKYVGISSLELFSDVSGECFVWGHCLQLVWRYHQGIEGEVAFSLFFLSFG